MKFPGKRKSKHYFPVTEKNRIPFMTEHQDPAQIYIVGIDQLLVDIEARIDDLYLAKYNIAKGQSSLLDDTTVDRIYTELKREEKIVGEFAGGAIGNTVHNYSVLADDQSYLLGTITPRMALNDYAFHYIRNTSSRVNLSHLHACEGPMGRAICLITPDGERSFAVSRGIMNELPAEAIPEKLIASASALVLTTYLLRDEKAPIYSAAMKALEFAHRYEVPVVLTLGTEALVREKKEKLLPLIQKYVCVLAGNLNEFSALTQEPDPLLAAQAALEFSDLTLLTRDQHGLYIGAYVDQSVARETRDQIHSKSISEYNRYEYSRAMLKSRCTKPLKIFSHINPYLGGPSQIRNTNGAGDSALAALLHDMAANEYHRQAAPASPKHKAPFLTYSSIHQICKYSNRVSFEVLRRNSPRLMHGLPEQEDSLEEAYWDK